MDKWQSRKRSRTKTRPVNPYWGDGTIAPHVPYELNYFPISKERYDIGRMVADLNAVVSATEWKDKDMTGGWSSITLKSATGKDQSFLEKTRLGVGSENNYVYTEAIESCPYLRTILDAMPTDVYLVRLLRLEKGGRIKFHTDKDVFSQKSSIVRCHIPITTNERVRFQIGYPLASPAPGYHVWKAEVLHERHLEAGILWYTNVNTLHGVVNHGTEDRVHLVIDMRPPEWLTKYLC